ncbi:hypothetical protein FNV66_44060 [Streptomyces sp. S1D4-14]|nr:hypothetical protein FNV67_45210 [Streptomyces sp. S1D4-20]QDN74083.1 hypothetical protein FNV66_44060 [Streptomyces sp. S1D4-14]QDO56667.1 hypothetical protein FNV60_42540 [Streptomyces sp. RLB3-5]QDO66568.1 hypothetical protein FNV59_44790 [Streptomyces sp. RLB1-8]
MVRPRRVGVVTAAALPAGPVAAPSHATERRPPPRRIVENLDRGPVAVPSGEGTFLSRRLLGTEYALPQVLGSARTGGTPTGDAIAFNVYKGGRRLSGAPVTRSTTYQDDGRGTGTHTVRALVNGHEREPSSAALDFARGYAEIPPERSEPGVVSRLPWYHYDADTGQRLVTGEHPAEPTSESDLDVGRGSAADIDPRHPRYEYWTSGPRNATPFYGDLLGDWREEVLAETGDHTALRLHTTTEPTKTRIYRLARNPAHRLGWTVRGCLQSTHTDYCLGTETRRVPKPAITTTARTEGTS